MIRVHCLVSCVCDVLGKLQIDERPYYFGVWDAEFAVTGEGVLSYHSEQTRQQFLRDWYERLYGVRIQEWYDHGAPKSENVTRLESLMATPAPSRQLIVMLDLFVLPERENKFNQDPFPHYVMLEPTGDPDTWLMRDPDYRWEGKLPRTRVLEAVARPSVTGGYLFDAAHVRPPDTDTVRAYFEASFIPDENLFTEALRRIVRQHEQEQRLGQLGDSLKQIPVMSIRKWAYEHGFAYFWRALQLDHAEFLRWCDEVEALVNGYKVVQFRALKAAATGSSGAVAGVLEQLDQQDARERRIKRGLAEAYDQWVRSLGTAPHPTSHGAEESLA